MGSLFVSLSPQSSSRTPDSPIPLPDSFYRAAIPDDINAGSPNPSGWGKPVAFLSPDSCDPIKYFTNHSIIFGVCNPRSCPVLPLTHATLVRHHLLRRLGRQLVRDVRLPGRVLRSLEGPGELHRK